MSLFDVLSGAGGGEALRLLAERFGIPEAEVRRAAEAFLPAFSAGIKQSTASLPGLMEFMRTLAGGAFAGAYRDPMSFGRAGAPSADALRMLFGSMDGAQAILKQASAVSGVPEDRLQALMAPLAAMTLGGIAAQAKAANPALDAMLKQFGFDTPKPASAAKGPLDRLEEEQDARERAAAGTEELQRMQRQMMEAGLAAFQAGTAAWQKAMADLVKAGGGAGGTSGEPVPQVSVRDLFGEMLEPGLRLSEAYQREMEALVERLRAQASG